MTWMALERSPISGTDKPVPKHIVITTVPAVVTHIGKGCEKKKQHNFLFFAVSPFGLRRTPILFTSFNFNVPFFSTLGSIKVFTLKFRSKCNISVSPDS